MQSVGTELSLNSLCCLSLHRQQFSGLLLWNYWVTARNAATKCSKRLGKEPLSEGVDKCFLQSLKSLLTILCKNDLTCQFILITLCIKAKNPSQSYISVSNFTVVPRCLDGWSSAPWGGGAVFLPDDTIPQVPLSAVNQALGSHWPVKLHLAAELFLVTPQHNHDGAAQVVSPSSPQLCGGSTGQLCPWCPPAAPLALHSLVWAAAVPHSESLSPREPQWALPAAPPHNTSTFLRAWNTSREEDSLWTTNCKESQSEKREMYQFLAIALLAELLQDWDEEKW